MAMKPRDAAKAKGCIDSLMSFTKAKLLPHVPEMTIRFTHKVESGTFPMAYRKSTSTVLMGRATKGGFGTIKSSVAAMPEAGRLGKVFHP